MANGFLTTHVLDTALGVPARGVGITLYRLDGNDRFRCASTVTNADGRSDAPLLSKGHMTIGIYELVFSAGAYLRASGTSLPEPLFLEEVPIRFGISDVDAHYHVPLLLSPFGYSTYRGS